RRPCVSPGQVRAHAAAPTTPREFASIHEERKTNSLPARFHVGLLRCSMTHPRKSDWAQLLPLPVNAIERIAADTLAHPRSFAPRRRNKKIAEPILRLRGEVQDQMTMSICGSRPIRKGK